MSCDLPGACFGTFTRTCAQLLAGQGRKGSNLYTACIVALNADIVPRLLARVRPEAMRLIEQHRAAGRATYIVSASPIELVEPLAKALGMTAGIGTRSEIIDGRYTGQLVGPFCYGDGKVTAISELAEWEGFDLDKCYAYSDSASDLPMMSAVGHPVAVNPETRLAAIARKRGSLVEHWSKASGAPRPLLPVAPTRSATAGIT